MDSIFWYATPAFLALAVKIWLVINSDKRALIIGNWPLALFFFAISIINIIEVVTYTTTFGSAFYSIFIKLYNGAILLSLCFLMIFTGIIADFSLFTRTRLAQYYAALSAVLFIVITTTDWFVAGYETVGYGFTRIPGDFYQVIPGISFFNLLLSFIFLFYGYLRKDIKPINRKRCKAILVSYLPFMICLMIIIFLMETGVKITGAIIIPFTTTYLLVVLVLTESEKGLFRFLLKTPYTQEHKTMKTLVNNLQHLLSETSMGNTVSLKALSSDIEKELITHTVNQNESDQANAARIQGISPPASAGKKSNEHNSR